MEIIIQSNCKEVNQLAARFVARVIGKKPNCVLGLATGNTPLMLYKELIRMHQKEGLNFSEVTTFNLDEYVGIPANHPSSYHTYMWEHFFKHINIQEHNVNIPDGMTPDVPAFCKKYEEAIKACGGIDLQILGIGSDGHIGFNEPTSSLASRTRIKTFTRQTIQDNSVFFTNEKVPHHGITMGIGTIMEGRQCILLAFGKKKADAVARSIEGPVSSMVPASILQMHPNAIFIIDEDAAHKLQKRDYYRWIYQYKPDWQRI